MSVPTSHPGPRSEQRWAMRMLMSRITVSDVLAKRIEKSKNRESLSDSRRRREVFGVLLNWKVREWI